ncbi:MAG: cadmium resistance transporter [Pseudanabaena sp.]|jgi:cadmium resistance protein CadD (predicted permease)|nr:cadmium resistance transporter [Pseudanabaena sp. M090S1SP2A07QC]MCA6508227.1 cadmium resistance transporter [Pseudanabaena sp. M172S2SP2A07QC]MCA6510072.1 cadmium resistance transporter [Pseudanabaena sp. M109S1SP2A07QC]MCA6518960.1 cadmium resistance transporter [Pseudanabaena sp. M110S1SP2A07QC]MCA6527086.1 cadmium resistance transporter [Pseudanabaena sp. M179S2SP2A07QC]MCA6536535.1 cadmium resistance transporter [Pseudanabaena sp. M176S2SP2A07QC]MCA6540496.1 cadmium resistance transpo
MSLESAIATGAAVALATTFDDNIYLTSFFGRVSRTFRPRHVVVGEFLGLTILISISLVGYFVGMVVSDMWVGLLGVLPIMIGIHQLMGKEDDENSDVIEEVEKVHIEVGRPRIKQSLWSTIRDPKTHRVTAVHVSNGGNNVAVYIPLFASSSLPSLAVILTMCYMTIGFWCFCSYNLTRFPGISVLIARYGRKIAPFVLIYLGFSIIIKSQSYRLVLSV